MTRAATWHGRRGPVILGPTEHRVARWLADRTRPGRVTIRTVDLAAATHVERSEAYRITARLRVLGLFGIENDRAGTHGGRRYWRTAIEHDYGALDAARHRAAWSRIVAWAAAGRVLAAARLATIRDRSHLRRDDVRIVAWAAAGRVLAAARLATIRDRSHLRRDDVLHGRPAPTAAPFPPGAAVTFLDRLVAGGLKSALATEFGQ